ncbi:MAG: hypothetical protein KA007_01235 [Candidatus Pacebacteria bacterium]|nr:hypothetical protein [Candidatus Paceibacterota bacterium]
MDIQRQNFLKECDAQNKAKKFAEFKKEFEDKLFSKYGITIGDCTDENALMVEFEDGATAEEFIEFLADKHNLTPKNSFF